MTRMPGPWHGSVKSIHLLCIVRLFNQIVVDSLIIYEGVSAGLGSLDVQQEELNKIKRK